MASLLQKVASAIARPFTKDLRVMLERIQNQEAKSVLIDHSRQMAENMELLCNLQTALCEKLDASAKIHVDKLEALAKTQQDKWEAMAGVQASLSTKVDCTLRRFAFPLDAQRALVRTSVGYLICDRGDASLLAQLIESGDQEPGLRGFLERYLEAGMTFVDVGAHIGMHTIAAARCVGRNGKVHAFEATPVTAQFLTENVLHNGMEFQTTVHPGFVGSAAGVTPFHLSPIHGHNSKYPLPAETSVIELAVMTLDEVLKDVPAVDLIKVDVEGAELDVFAGMRKLLQRSPEACVVAEFSPIHLKRSGTTEKDWMNFCQSHDFELFLVEEPTGTLHPTSFAQLMSTETTNVLMARGKSFQRAL